MEIFPVWSVYFFCNAPVVMQDLQPDHNFDVVVVVAVKENIFETIFSVLEVNLHYTQYTEFLHSDEMHR
jgi:hypothetical protein